MAMKVSASEAYQESMRKLFPCGSYWDRQFEDPQSDCSLFCRAKADLLVRIRNRMSYLQSESVVQTAGETLPDWERVLLGSVNAGLSTGQRRAILSAARAGNISIGAIKAIGRVYGITITDVVFPFRPAFFGHSFFGIDTIAGPAALSVLFVCASQPAPANRNDFEKHLISRVLSNYIVYFIYGGS
jgi:hypothetical protein